MIHLFSHPYLLWITYLFSNIILILGHNELTTCMNTSSIFTQWINMISVSFISMALGIFINKLIEYYQLQNVIPIVESSKYQQSNTYTTNIKVKRHKEIVDLPDFIPLTSYRSFHINQTTSLTTVDELIDEAKETKRFTIFLYDDKLSNKMFIQIEFIQEFQSIITIFEVFRRRSFLFDRIEQLFSIIFDSSNTIYTWGHITHLWLYYQDYGFFFNNYIDKVHILDAQEDFKLWYNQTFGHNEKCDQILDFHDTDGPLCSCSYRPYKCLKDAWSLHVAITYTFHENLSNENDSAYECLAITKLTTVIQEKWTRQQLNDYINKHHADHQVNMTLP